MNTNTPNQEPKQLPLADESQKHYTTPEGYLDGLPDRIMSQIPEEPVGSQDEASSGWWIKVKPIVYLAASFAGVYYGFRAMQWLAPDAKPTRQPTTMVHAEPSSEDEYLLFYQDYSESLSDREYELSLGEEINAAQAND